MTHSPQSTVRQSPTPTTAGQRSISRSLVRNAVQQGCEDCRATNAFQAWEQRELAPSEDWLISFAEYGIPPTGRRAVIELVTAQIVVPEGEWARLRMYTTLGPIASNMDIFLTFQGNVTPWASPGPARAIYVATHQIRAYSDSPVEFDINRDNAETTGYALICISGYLVDA